MDDQPRPSDEEFELDAPEDESASPRRDPYRLPADLFTDPFEDDEPESQREVFLPAFLGADDEELTPPSLSGFGQRRVAEAELSLKERLARAVQGIGESDREREEAHFAGADVSPPSLRERLRPRRRPQPLEPAIGPGDEVIAADDPFARLLTPLAGPQLARLQAEVADDEVLFVRYERTRQSSLQRQGMGLVFAVIMLTLFLVFAGREYLDQQLVETRAPEWMVKRLGSEHSGAVLFVLGLLLPFLSIGALADTFVYTLRSLVERSLVDLGVAILSACFAVAVFLLLIHALPFQAAVVLAVWFLFRLLINFVRRQ